jgi:transcriptional regulator with PAS, ATPase and Fis domain
MTHQISAPQPSSFFADLFKSFEVAILELTAESRFRLLGQPPAWFLHLYPQVARTGHATIGPESPVLQNFLTDAAETWCREEGALLRSGFWTEEDSSGRSWHLEATALRHGQHNLLLLQQGAGYDQQWTLLQAAREQTLHRHDERRRHRRAQQELTTKLEETELLKDDVLTILQHLGLAIVLVDEQGLVRFLSRAAACLLDLSEQASRLLSWEKLLPLAKTDRLALQAKMRTLDGRRERISCSIETAGGHRLWLDIEVQDDPRNEKTKLLVLHDRTEVHRLRGLLEEQARFHDLIGKSPGMVRVYQQIQDLARVDSTVLIDGDTGTGKELVARALHTASSRREAPFIAANCAGLTDSLLGSQLFGHRKGAFTGAIDDHQGLFEAAHGGTLFLDEIGDIPPHVQTSLLRVLQEKEVTRLGETRPRKVNVRVVAATHHDLNQDVAKGTFRADLFYRIRVARIHLPSLRERKEDIPLLAAKFLSDAQTAMGKAVARTSPATLAMLLDYHWPGNVRELKSAIECAVIHCTGDTLEPDDLPVEIRDERPFSASPIPERPADERSRILAALRHAHGNRTEAARALGMSRATFYRRLTGLDVPTE